MPSFAEFALARLPKLAQRLARKDVSDWLAAQESLLVDGQRRWLIWGDRLADEAEMKLDWARERRLIDPVALARLELKYGALPPDSEAVEIAPVPDDLQEKDNG
jgi:hypothetical protein